MHMLQPSLFTPLTIKVSELNHYLRQLLESDPLLQNIWVSGEISNLSKPASGHIYFTLMDETSSLRCVIWRSAVSASIKGILKDGLSIEAHGAITVYERGGQYQLSIDVIRPAGEGFLYQEFLRLKARLQAEGLFDEEKKRTICAWPQHIGIVTSPSGAALQDILNTLRHRFPLVRITIAPSSVQGEAAPQEIVTAIRAINRLSDVDTLLIARGGGSLEDLWAFNDERVVRAIATSFIPTITGIGHETDFTLADFAADRRAPTPTGAAVMASPDILDIRVELGNSVTSLHNRAFSILADYRQSLQDIIKRFQRSSPLQQIHNDQQKLDEFEEDMQKAISNRIRLLKTYLEGIQQRLNALNPQSVLQRGYTLVSKPDGSIITSIQQIKPVDIVILQVSDGKASAKINEILL